VSNHEICILRKIIEALIYRILSSILQTLTNNDHLFKLMNI